MSKKFWYLTRVSLKKKIGSKWFLVTNIILALAVIGIININSIIKFFGGDFSDNLTVYVIDNSNTYNYFEATLNSLDEDNLIKIEQIKTAIQENNMGRKEAFEAGAGDGWDSPEFEEIERINMMLVGELRRMYEILNRIVIIEKHNDQEIVDIGDVIVADMILSPDDMEEMTFKLVGASGDFNAEIQEISINSPLGNAVYKKKIGDTCSYSVNNRNFLVLLKTF